MRTFFAAIALGAMAPAALVVTAPSAFAKEEQPQFEIPTPPEGMGQIIFYRTGGLAGAALGCAVFDAGQEDKLSSLGSGRYFVLVSEPGERNFTVKSLETKDALTLEVEPDETQFVRCKIKSGFLSGRANIAPSSEKEFRKKYKKAKLVDADDMSEAVAATNYPADTGTASGAE